VRRGAGERDPWNQRTQENLTDFFPTSSSPWAPTPFEFDVANKKSVAISAHVTSKDLPPGYLVSFEPPTIIIPAESTVRVKGVLSLDSTIIPPVTPQNPRPPDPGIFHVIGAERAGDFERPLGGITYRVFPDMSVDVDVTVWVDGDGNVVVDGTTHPAQVLWGGARSDSDAQWRRDHFPTSTVATMRCSFPFVSSRMYSRRSTPERVR
jgi:hypothetical protein